MTGLSTVERGHGHVGGVMELLRRGVPLSLLFDLVEPDGPASSEIYHLEGLEPARPTESPQGLV